MDHGPSINHRFITYPVHALKILLLKNTGIGAVSLDLAYLVAFAAAAMFAATVLFRRTL